MVLRPDQPVNLVLQQFNIRKPVCKGKNVLRNLWQEKQVGETNNKTKIQAVLPRKLSNLHLKCD